VPGATFLNYFEQKNKKIQCRINSLINQLLFSTIDTLQLIV